MKPHIAKDLYDKAGAMVRAMDSTYAKNEAICKDVKAAESRIKEEFTEVENTCTRAIAVLIYLLVFGTMLNIGICVLLTYLLK